MQLGVASLYLTIVPILCCKIETEENDHSPVFN